MATLSVYTFNIADIVIVHVLSYVSSRTGNVGI